MKKRKLFFTFVLALATHFLLAQSSETIRKYIDTYKDVAVEEEMRTGVPAAITLAQGIHETSAGTSDLVLSSNNHFGIKCKTGWNGASVYHDDDAKGECFRKYDDPIDSYKDHSDFLKGRPNYSALFNLNPEDYKGWAYGLKKAGYATNPRYPEILIKLIEEYHLQDFTLIALSKLPGDNNIVYASHTEKQDEVKPVVEPVVEKKFIRPDYPAGKFKINETNVLFVEKGTAYLKIADENDISLARLYEFNDMKPVDIATADGLLYLQRKRKTGAHEFHIVADGESLYDIAQTEAIRFESLLEYNFLQPNMKPQTGEKLYLQSKAPSMPRLMSATIDVSTQSEKQMQPDEIAGDNPNLYSENFIMHTVQPKETMYAIAKKYSVAVDEVQKWNDLQTTDLRTGQQLRINKKTTNASN